MKLKHRPYGPDSTVEEIKAIKDRISLHSSGIILFRELPVQSVFHLDLFEQRINELSRKLHSYCLLIDLTEAEFPDADVRIRLKKLFGSLARLRGIAAFTGRNFLMNTAARYVLNEPYLPPFTVHTTQQEALEALVRTAKAS